MDAEAMRAEITAAFAAPEANRWLLSNRVSVEHRYIAFMAAKAACSTIKMALHQFESPDVPLEKWSDVHREAAGPRLVEQSPDDVLTMLSSPEWFRFCVVRNPYDRLASAWKQKLPPNGDSGYEWLRHEIRQAAGGPASAQVTFRESVEYLLANDSTMASDVHWLPMTNTMRPDLIAYDAVGRFENFAEDFGTILRRVGAPDDAIALASVVTNATGPTALRDLYDEHLARGVYDHYELDFEAFGYAQHSWRSSWS